MKARHEFETEAAYLEYLRHYYAGLALAALISSPIVLEKVEYIRTHGGNLYEGISAAACERADALITELQKPIEK